MHIDGCVNDSNNNDNKDNFCNLEVNFSEFSCSHRILFACKLGIENRPILILKMT